MAVPKHKASKMQTNSRFANFRAAMPQVGECPQCHEPKQSHRICPHCGYYDGVQKVEVEKEKK
jgi:large subunit ribosomal protein L32